MSGGHNLQSERLSKHGTSLKTQKKKLLGVFGGLAFQASSDITMQE